jgi:cell division septation protein DedD
MTEDERIDASIKHIADYITAQQLGLPDSIGVAFSVLLGVMYNLNRADFVELIDSLRNEAIEAYDEYDGGEKRTIQ